MTTSHIPFSTLLTELTDPDSQVRLQAISSILRRRSERGQVCLSLLALLKDADEQVCKAAIKALGTIHDPCAFPHLAQELPRYSPPLRLLALKTLEQLDFPQAIRYWLEARYDLNKRIFRQAHIALGDTHAVEPLITILSDPESQLRGRAAMTLGELGDTRAVEPLLTALGHSDTSDREWVIRALGDIGDTRAVEPLLVILNDADARFRSGAIYALGKLGDARAVDALIPLAQDDGYRSLRWQIASALGKLGDTRAVTPLLTMLDDTDADVCLSAVSSLGDLGDTRAVEPLLTMLNNTTGGLRRVVARSLGKLGDTRALPPLQALLTDSSVAPQAQQALSRLGENT